jgi:hypothetical protein
MGPPLRLRRRETELTRGQRTSWSGWWLALAWPFDEQWTWALMTGSPQSRIEPRVGRSDGDGEWTSTRKTGETFELERGRQRGITSGNRNHKSDEALADDRRVRGEGEGECECDRFSRGGREDGEAEAERERARNVKLESRERAQLSHSLTGSQASGERSSVVGVRPSTLEGLHSPALSGPPSSSSSSLLRLSLSSLAFITRSRYHLRLLLSYFLAIHLHFPSLPPCLLIPSPLPPLRPCRTSPASSRRRLWRSSTRPPTKRTSSLITPTPSTVRISTHSTPPPLTARTIIDTETPPIEMGGRPRWEGRPQIPAPIGLHRPHLHRHGIPTAPLNRLLRPSRPLPTQLLLPPPPRPPRPPLMRS